MICNTCRHLTPARTCAVYLAGRGGVWWIDLEQPKRCRHHEPRSNGQRSDESGPTGSQNDKPRQGGER